MPWRDFAVASTFVLVKVYIDSLQSADGQILINPEPQQIAMLF